MSLSSVNIPILLRHFPLREKRYSLLISWDLAFSRIANARSTNGTRWARPAFILSAGTIQTLSMTSLRLAPVSSPVRAAVNIANSSASAVMASRPCSISIRWGTSEYANAGWCFTLETLLGCGSNVSKCPRQSAGLTPFRSFLVVAADRILSILPRRRDAVS